MLIKRKCLVVSTVLLASFLQDDNTATQDRELYISFRLTEWKSNWCFQTVLNQ